MFCFTLSKKFKWAEIKYFIQEEMSRVFCPSAPQAYGSESKLS